MAVKVLNGPLPGTGRSPTVFKPTETLPLVAKAGGKWCEVGVYKSTRTACSRAVRCRSVHGERYEFASRAIDGKGVLFARLRTEEAK